jgi:hypothetical protein
MNWLFTECFPEPLQCDSERLALSGTNKYPCTLVQLDISHLHRTDHPNLTGELHSIDTAIICAIRGLNRGHLLKQSEEFGLLL